MSLKKEILKPLFLYTIELNEKNILRKFLINNNCKLVCKLKKKC